MTPTRVFTLLALALALPQGAENALAAHPQAQPSGPPAAMAKWLRAHLPDEYTLLASPAVRAQQTAAALETKIVTDHALAPGATPSAIIQAAQKHKGLIIVVGHQPDLGRTAAQLVANARGEWSVQKGAIWWLEGAAPARVKAVVSPDLL